MYWLNSTSVIITLKSFMTRRHLLSLKVTATTGQLANRDKSACTHFAPGSMSAELSLPLGQYVRQWDGMSHRESELLGVLSGSTNTEGVDVIVKNSVSVVTANETDATSTSDPDARRASHGGSQCGS